MDESNHEMVNMLTTQIGTVFNPLIQNTNDSYQMLAYQMSRIADFFGTPPPPRLNQPVRQPIMPVAPVVQVNQGQIPNIRDEPLNHEEVEQNPPIFLVNQNQNADEVVRNVQNDQFAGQNNLTNLVETILTQKGLNVGSRRPNSVSTLSEYVLQTELPRGWKVPKYTKFAGDTNEEHIARYLAESGNLANNENLRLK
jgi:hypothetical protein